MAFDSSNFSVPQESSCYMQLGWQCDFYFGYGFDAIEEDALNEKHCVQVLRILITKADIEIDELEKDLVFLQNELAWVEYEEWSEICCNALRKQIDCLYIAVRRLKSKDKNDIEVRFLMYRKPVKRLHEILKALLRDYCNDKDKQNEQTLDVAVLDSSDSPGDAVESLEDNTKSDNSDTSVIVKEEIQASSITCTENVSILKTSLMCQEEKTNDSESVKVSLTNGKDSSLHSLKLEAGHLDEKKVSSSVDLESAMKGEAREDCFSPKCTKVVQNSSLKSTDERSHNIDMVKAEPADIMLKNSSRDVPKQAVSHSNKKKNLSILNSKIKREEVEENSSTSTADVIVLDSSLNPVEKSSNLGNRVKLANTVAKESGLSACTHEKGHYSVMTTMCKSDLEVNGKKEVTRKHKILGSSSNLGGKLNPPNPDKPVNNAAALRHATGVNGRRTNSDSTLAAPRQAKGGNSDISADALGHSTISRQEKDEDSANSLDIFRRATGLSGRRSNSDSALATSRHLQVGNSDISPAALKRATGLNQRRNDSDSKLGAFRRAKGRNSDIDQKLCDFAQRVASKRGINESNLTLADKLKSSNSSSGAEGKGKPSQQIVKVKKSCLTDTEQSGLTSLLNLQDDKGKDTTNAQPKEGKMQPEEVQMAENIANSEKFNIDLSAKPQKQYSKRKFKSNPPSVQETGLHSVEMVSNSSLISKAKKRVKSGLGSDTSNSSQSLDRKIMKKIVKRGQCEAEEQSIAVDGSQNLISKPQKKRKKNSSLPVLVEIKGSTLQIDCSKSHRDLNNVTGNSIPESYSIDSCTEIVTSSPFASSKLKELKICELRAIAKEQKLTKYHKLRKIDLAEQIANKLSSC